MNILLVCGGGASSGFLCQKMKKSAAERNMDMILDAVGEAELEDCLDGVDIVLFGPHLKYLEDDMKETLDSYNVPFAFIPEEYYGSLDGEKTLDYAIQIIQR